MESFQVPQYIEEESKLIWSFTFNQVLILILGGGLIYLSYALLASWVSLIFIIIIGSLTLILAFVQIEGMPSYKLIMPLIRHLWLPRIYIWKKNENVQTKKSAELEQIPTKSKFTSVKKNVDIKELSEILNKENK